MTAFPPRGFGRDEFVRRTGALQAEMAKVGLDALLLTTEPDVRYVTGFLTRFWESPTRPWFVVVPARGEPVAVIPEIGAALMARGWLTDIRTWPSPDLADDGVSLLGAAIADLTPEHATIGLPMDHETHLRMPLGDFAELKRRIAPRGFADATSTVRRVREVKSPAELAKIEAACAIAARAFARVPELAAAGKPLERVFRDFQIACLQEGADWVAYLAGGAGPDGYADVISPASPEPLAPGDVLMLDTGVVHDGYFCDFDRNFSIGPPSAAAARAHEALFAAVDAGLSAARPGATAADLFRAMHAAIASFGATPGGGRYGHGLGIQLTEWPSLIPADDTELRPGMVLTLEPGVELSRGRIMVAEENVVIEGEGARLLTPRAPAALPVLG